MKPNPPQSETVANVFFALFVAHTVGLAFLTVYFFLFKRLLDLGISFESSMATGGVAWLACTHWAVFRFCSKEHRSHAKAGSLVLLWLSSPVPLVPFFYLCFFAATAF